MTREKIGRIEMKGRSSLIIGFICIIIFIVIASIFWFWYFLDYHSNGTLTNTAFGHGKVVLVDIQGVNSTDEESKENGDDSPSYIFRVNNNKTGSANYVLYLEETPYNMVNDGCTTETTLQRSDLSYQLTMNGKIIKSGKMTEIEDNILDKQFINIDASNHYELKIWINEDADKWEGKHYHYKVVLKEVKA